MVSLFRLTLTRSAQLVRLRDCSSVLYHMLTSNCLTATMDDARDDVTSVAGSERSVKRRRTASGEAGPSPKAVERSQPAESSGHQDPVARMRAHVAAGQPVPEYDLETMSALSAQTLRKRNSNA